MKSKDTSVELTDEKVHYYLVAGSVVVEHDGNIQAVPQNAMITTDTPNVGEYQLGKAQQALQVTMFKKMGETMKVVDVILHNVCYLGHMSPKEFHAKPDGVGAQPVEKSHRDASVIDFTKAMEERT